MDDGFRRSPWKGRVSVDWLSIELWARVHRRVWVSTQEEAFTFNKDSQRFLGTQVQPQGSHLDYNSWTQKNHEHLISFLHPCYVTLVILNFYWQRYLLLGLVSRLLSCSSYTKRISDPTCMSYCFASVQYNETTLPPHWYVDGNKLCLPRREKRDTNWIRINTVSWQFK